MLNGTAGQASADSRITKINIGDVIKIDSVTSHARAATDGASPPSSPGSTVVQGMTIAGQPAYVDEQGVHIGEQEQPANAVASQIANQALNGGGFSFFVSQPQQEQSGASSSYTAGSLIICGTPAGQPGLNVFFFISLGGCGGGGDGDSSSKTAVRHRRRRRRTRCPLRSRPRRLGRGSRVPPASLSRTAAAMNNIIDTLGGKPIAATFDGLAGQVILGLLGSGLMFFRIQTSPLSSEWAKAQVT